MRKLIDDLNQGTKIIIKGKEYVVKIKHGIRLKKILLPNI